MKKTIALIILLLSLFSVSVAAKPGDVAGRYYSTDIVTTLNGAEIDSININGETLINAEDMRYYGFNVNWYADKRELRISSLDHASNGIPPKVVKSTLPSGCVLGNYYETDIVTYLDNKVITAYNIGGRTYIHAEETRSHGFDAIWNGIDRTLTVISPKFAGYEYTILLSQGKPQSTEGIGCFKMEYTDGKIKGYGDAEYFSSVFNSYGDSYSVLLQFNQGDGLFYSTKLLETLRKYADTDKTADEDITLSVNGIKAAGITVSSYNGNGHNSFYITCNKGLKLNKESIRSIELSVGTSIPTDSFEMTRYESSTTIVEKLFTRIKENPLDRLESFYLADGYTVLVVAESKSPGDITNKMYIVNEDGEFSSDVLYHVRKIDGFNENKLRVYAIKVGAIKNNLFFSCASSRKNGDFYVEMNNGAVHLIAQKDR